MGKGLPPRTDPLEHRLCLVMILQRREKRNASGGIGDPRSAEGALYEAAGARRMVSTNTRAISLVGGPSE
jgi:hypothetical protein